MKDPRKELFVLDDTVYVPAQENNGMLTLASDDLGYWF